MAHEAPHNLSLLSFGSDLPPLPPSLAPLEPYWPLWNPSSMSATVSPQGLSPALTEPQKLFPQTSYSPLPLLFQCHLMKDAFPDHAGWNSTTCCWLSCILLCFCHIHYYPFLTHYIPSFTNSLPIYNGRSTRMGTSFVLFIAVFPASGTVLYKTGVQTKDSKWVSCRGTILVSGSFFKSFLGEHFRTGKVASCLTQHLIPSFNLVIKYDF